MSHSPFTFVRGACAATAAAWCLAAQAGPIGFDSFWEFGVDGVGNDAVGCQPADPAGLFCIPSGGTPTFFLDAPAWTFSVGGGSAILTVVDAFVGGDRFQVFDFGVSLGLTSALPPGNVLADCGDDPVVCLADPGISRGFFALGAGNHSITIRLAEGDLGSAYLHVAGAAGVPVPPTLALLFGGLSGLWLARRKDGHNASGSTT